MKKETGISLIEMIIVIAIIGLLSSIILTGLGNARTKARDARRISDILQVQNALEVYYAVRGEYPTDLVDLPNNIPTDPIEGEYSFIGFPQTYTFGTCLELERPPSIEHYNSSRPITSSAGRDCNCADTDNRVYCVKNFE